MKRLVFVVEGPSEEAFIKELLIPHLAAFEVFGTVTIVGKRVAARRGHGARGGGHFRHWNADIRRILAGDGSDDLRVTTLFDLYGLPNDFPGLDEHSRLRDTSLRCDALAQTLAERVADRRFIPYLQRHELEALVLAALPQLAGVLDAREDMTGLADLQEELGTASPEEINDGRETAPSKRLEKHLPSYRKLVHGPLAVGAPGSRPSASAVHASTPG